MTTAVPPVPRSAEVRLAPARSGQRERILDIALALMAEKGASGTSMRTLAAACDLNVAALYHYFPSKDALLRAVIDERRYDVQLEHMPLPDLRLPPDERLVALVLAMWDGALDEAPIWRLLLSEALHGDAAAREVGDDLRRTIEAALAEAVARVVPEVAVAPDLAARTIAGTLFALMLEATLIDGEALEAHARRRATDVASLLLIRS